MLDRRHVVAGGLASAAFVRSTSFSLAQVPPYPIDTIRAICMFAPGSGADVKTRFYAHALAEKTGATVIVENRPGAMGYIGTEYAARAKPDGYTIFIAPGSSMLAAAPYLFKTLRFDPINDFAHLTTLNVSAFVLCVAGASPFHSVADLTAHLRREGSKASYASIAPPGLVASEIYRQAFGLETIEVKYKEAGPLIIDLMNDVVSFAHIDIISVAGLIKDGRIRPLALTSADPIASMPGIPGAAEAGIPGMNIRNWWSVHVPARTPQAVCGALERWFQEIAVARTTVQFLTDNYADPMPGDARMVKALLVQETKDWKTYATLAKIEPL